MKKVVSAGKQPHRKKETPPIRNQLPINQLPAIYQKQERACKLCGNIFTPKRCTSEFCSLACYNRNYYLTHLRTSKKPIPQSRISKIESPLIVPAPNSPLMPDAADDMINIKEAARRLNCCKQSIYNLINAGKIHVIHFSGRLSFVRWSEILTYSGVPETHVETLPTKPKPQTTTQESADNGPQQTFPLKARTSTAHGQKEKRQRIHIPDNSADEPEWCTAEYGMQHFHFKSIEGFYNFATKHKVKKRKKGRPTLYSMADLHIASTGISPELLSQGYVSIRQAAHKYAMPLTTIYHKVIRHGIKTITYKGKSLFLENDLRSILTEDEIAC